MSPFISVIVPVYNAEKYLRECLDSLKYQTLDNIEIILVDDGSEDNSGIICDEYAGQDERFKAYHIKNGGRSRARNWGIEHSEGEYLTFVDSDDYIELNTFNEVYEIINKEKADVCCYGMKYIFDNREMACIPFRNICLTDNFIKYGVYMHSVCNKVFKRSIIVTNDIRFETELSVCEDLLFTFKALIFAEKTEYLNAHLYYYRKSTDLKKADDYSEIEFSGFRKSYEYLRGFCEERGIDIKYRRFLRYREIYYAILYLVNPGYFSPQQFRASRSRGNVWTYSFRPDYFVVSVCSAVHFDIPAQIYIWIKRKYKKISAAV